MTGRIDDIERLQRLRDSGAIDEAEFAREKARLLDGERGYRLLPVFGVLFAIVVLVAVALFAWRMVPGSSDAPTPVASASSSVAPGATPVGVASLLPDERLAAAVKAVWPDGARAESEDGEHYVFARHLLVDAPFGPVLVSEGKVHDAAHVSAGRLDIAYLAPEGSGYRATRRFPAAVKVGSFGQMSEWSIGDKLSDLPVIDAEGGFTGQGYTCAYDVLTELQPKGPVALASIQTSYDNSGAVESGGQSIEGRITDVDKGAGFAVAYGGTKSFTERYVRQGDKFVRQGATALPSC